MDEVLAPIMRQVGDEWANGALRIADEHRTTSLVVSLLHRLALECDGTVEADGSSRVAIVACLPSVAHELGALMAHLVLRSQGWKTHYLGLGLPVEDVSDFQAKTGAQLVCLSVAPPRGMPEVRHAADLLARLYRPESPYRLAFGGSGVRHTDEFDPFRFESLGLFDSTRQFSRWLTEQND